MIQTTSACYNILSIYMCLAMTLIKMLGGPKQALPKILLIFL